MGKDLSFKCRSCNASLKATPDDSGNTSACPKCSTWVTVPYPGIGRVAFIGLKVTKYFVLSVLAAAMGDAGMLVIIPVSLVLIGVLAYQRVINIGHPPWMTVLGYIPGASIWLAIERPGAATRRRLEKAKVIAKSQSVST